MDDADSKANGDGQRCDRCRCKRKRDSQRIQPPHGEERVQTALASLCTLLLDCIHSAGQLAPVSSRKGGPSQPLQPRSSSCLVLRCAALHSLIPLSHLHRIPQQTDEPNPHETN